MLCNSALGELLRESAEAIFHNKRNEWEHFGGCPWEFAWDNSAEKKLHDKLINEANARDMEGDFS